MRKTGLRTSGVLAASVLLGVASAAGGAIDTAERLELSVESASAASPGDIAAGSDGNLWFPLIGSDTIGRIRPGGEITTFPVRGAAALGHAIVAGPDGRLWIVGTGTDAKAHLWAISTSGATGDVAILDPSPSVGAAYEVSGMAAGPDGNVWIANLAGVLRVSRSGQLVRFSLPDSGDVADAIAQGPDGNMWVVASEGPFISRRQVLFRVSGNGSMTAVFTQTGSSGTSAPTSIVLGPDGALWIADYGLQEIVRFQLQPPTRTMIPFDGAFRLAAGPDGEVWVTPHQTGFVAHMPSDGTITFLPLPTANSDASAIVTGPDHNVWVTEPRSRAIARITPAGGITEFAVGPAAKYPIYRPRTPRPIESR